MTLYSMRWRRVALGLAFYAAIVTGPVRSGADSTVEAAELAEMSLEDLLSLEVTSVSRKAERSSEAAAALYVVTNEDIRRSGSRTIADALRLVPGVHVGQIDSSQWAVGLRGFSGQLNNKLQVLIDGRSVYTPLFSGVFWDVQDTLIEDVDRIEVIRGPGGTLWGANAVNGVINVITKTAKETQGGLVVGGGGTEERGFGAFRYGGKIGDNFHYRLYGKYFDRDSGFDASRVEVDDWRMGRLGFRTEWDATETDTFTLLGDLYDGEAGPLSGPAGPDVERQLSGASLLGRWLHRDTADSDSQVQDYYDYTDRNDLFVRDRRGTFDVDTQSRVPLRFLPVRQELIFGLGYRLYTDHVRDGTGVVVDPDERHVQLPSAFIQDEIRLIDERLRITLGTKIEHTDFTGWEVSPSARAAYVADSDQVIWASISRAVRVTSRLENDIRLESGPTEEIPVPTVFTGNRGLGAETLLAYEVGYRVQPAEILFGEAAARPRFFLDVALFYNDYEELVTFAPSDPVFVPTPPPGRLVVPVVAGNDMEGSIYGFEIAADASLAAWWRLRSSYSHTQIDLDVGEGSSDPFSAEGSTPRHMVSVRSFVDLPWDLQFDQVLRWLDALPSRGVGSYFGLDLRLGAHLPYGLELSLVGQNLLHDHHREFDGGTEVERGFYGKLSWRF